MAASARLTSARSRLSPTKPRAATMRATVMATRPPINARMPTSPLHLDDAAHPEAAQTQRPDTAAEHRQSEWLGIQRLQVLAVGVEHPRGHQDRHAGQEIG